MNFMDRKVWASGLSGMAAGLLVLIAQRFFGVAIPADVASFLVVAAATGMGYIVPPSVQDIVKRIDHTIVEAVNADPKIPLVKGTAPSASTTVTGPGGAGRSTISVILALFLILPLLAACGSVKTVESAAPVLTATPIKQAVETVKGLSDEEKWTYACRGADGLYVGYVLMVAPKLKDATNQAIQATYEGVKAVCADKPTDFAAAALAAVRAFNAFKAALPAKAV